MSKVRELRHIRLEIQDEIGTLSILKRNAEGLLDSTTMQLFEVGIISLSALGSRLHDLEDEMDDLIL